MRRCATCGEDSSAVRFTKNSASKDGLDYHCVSCKRQRQNAWSKANPHRAFAYQIKHKYGLTIDHYDQMLIEQSGRCAICEAPLQGYALEPHIDHNNEWGHHRVRGLLCTCCDIGLGYFYHNIAHLKAAIGYLRSNGHEELCPVRSDRPRKGSAVQSKWLQAVFEP